MKQAICAVCMGDFHTVTLNERVCQGCLADAKLGRLVRSMPKGSQLIYAQSSGGVELPGGWFADFPTQSSGKAVDTPEEALERAMGEGK